MTTERTNHDAADRKIDEWADESRQQRGEATAVESRPQAQPTDDDRSPSQATSTADFARAGSQAGEEQHDTAVGPGQGAEEDQRPAALFADEDASGYRDQWQGVQTDFVDDPRQAVQRADALVAQLMQELANTFASERSTLEQQWDRGGEVSTEDLRVALRRYRSFFDRLLSL